jgi:hypothetical protein
MIKLVKNRRRGLREQEKLTRGRVVSDYLAGYLADVLYERGC